jgi:hypothetical protein
VLDVGLEHVEVDDHAGGGQDVLGHVAKIFFRDARLEFREGVAGGRRRFSGLAPVREEARRGASGQEVTVRCHFDLCLESIYRFADAQM